MIRVKVSVEIDDFDFEVEGKLPELSSIEDAVKLITNVGQIAQAALVEDDLDDALDGIRAERSTDPETGATKHQIDMSQF